MVMLWPFVFVFAVAYGDPCPAGYIQAGNGGNCYMGLSFYDTFSGQYFSKSYNEAEAKCSEQKGGLLASIHSVEENEMVQDKRMKCEQYFYSIGLKCKGQDCKWDDGSTVNYLNFKGDGPSNDGKTRCYGIDMYYYESGGPWTEADCDKQQKNCWICSVKAKTIECNNDETEYKGGCLSVHTAPLDQKSVTEACPGGGNLVSIHSGNENDNIYMHAALSAGYNGTIKIGGEFTKGVFEWTDGSNIGYSSWADGFPNTFFGNCVQMLLAPELAASYNQGKWSNIDCNEKLPYLCFRDGSTVYPTASFPNNPKAPATCPSIQYLSDKGTIYSPNYPLSIPAEQSCEYMIGTGDGTRASVKFSTYDCKSGTTLSLFDGLDSVVPFMTFTTNPPSIDEFYYATSSVLKILFTVNGTSAPIGTGWEAEYSGK